MIAASLVSDKLGGNNVILIEKLDRVGKKLSVTGNGQGNLTNTDLSLQRFHSGVKGFADYAISHYGNAAAEAFYNSRGIFLTGEGKRYPASKQASAVTDALRLRLAADGVTVLTGTEVKGIEKRGGVFEIVADNGSYASLYAVLAFGGHAAKQYGTDGTAYKLAEGFGHKITALYPSLVQLKTEIAPIRGLKGVKTEAAVTANGKTTSRGDVLFTEYGVSGSAIFAVSGELCRGGALDIEFLPEFTEAEVAEMLSARERLGYRGAELTGGLLHSRLGCAVYSRSDGTVKGLARAVKKFTLQATGTLGFDYAQATKGGIDVIDVNPETMESKLEKGLYIIGEALDVDGDCGGYNLQWAFSSAAAAAVSIYENR